MNAMRKKLIVGNWKMHGSRPANAELLAGILAARPFLGDVAVCVPSVDAYAAYIGTSPALSGVQAAAATVPVVLTAAVATTAPAA